MPGVGDPCDWPAVDGDQAVTGFEPGAGRR